MDGGFLGFVALGATMKASIITRATNAAPIAITSAGHGLSTGTRVTISGVGGNTAANASWVVTVVNSNSFSLDSSTGNGAYTSGGSWKVSGLYEISLAPTGGNGFAQGGFYTVLITSVVGGTTYAVTYSFGVV